MATLKTFDRSGNELELNRDKNHLTPTVISADNPVLGDIKKYVLSRTRSECLITPSFRSTNRSNYKFMSKSINKFISVKESSGMVWILSLMLFILCSSLPVHASSKTPGKVIAGWVEKITLPASGGLTKAITIKAKLDTGAETSSIHAEDIKIFKRGNKRWVDFTLVVKDTDDKTHRITMKKPREFRVNIKNHYGDHDSRPIVAFDVCFDGRIHSTLFSLADRSEFIYPALLGRKFLEGVAVVDPQASFLTQAYCE